MSWKVAKKNKKKRKKTEKNREKEKKTEKNREKERAVLSSGFLQLGLDAPPQPLEVLVVQLNRRPFEAVEHEALMAIRELHRNRRFNPSSLQVPLAANRCVL